MLKMNYLLTLLGTMFLSASAQAVLGDSPAPQVIDQVSSSAQNSTSLSGSVRDCIQICLVEHPGNQSYCLQKCTPTVAHFYFMDPIQPITQGLFYSGGPVKDCIQICLIEHPGNQTYCEYLCTPRPMAFTTEQVLSQSQCSQVQNSIQCGKTYRPRECQASKRNRRDKGCAFFR